MCTHHTTDADLSCLPQAPSEFMPNQGAYAQLLPKCGVRADPGSAVDLFRDFFGFFLFFSFFFLLFSCTFFVSIPFSRRERKG